MFHGLAAWSLATSFLCSSCGKKNHTFPLLKSAAPRPRGVIAQGGIVADDQESERSGPVILDPFANFVTRRFVGTRDGFRCLSGSDVDSGKLALDQLRYVASDSERVSIGALRAVVAGIGPDADGVLFVGHCRFVFLRFSERDYSPLPSLPQAGEGRRGESESSHV